MGAQKYPRRCRLAGVNQTGLRGDASGVAHHISASVFFASLFIMNLRKNTKIIDAGFCHGPWLAGILLTSAWQMDQHAPDSGRLAIG